MYGIWNKITCNPRQPIGTALWAKHADMHSHIIPGVDDGSPDLDESLRMIRVSYQSGVRCLYATPHIREGFRTSPDVLRKKLDELISLKDQAGMKDMELHLGAEYMLDAYFINQLSKGEVLSLPGKMALVETSFYALPMNLHEMLSQVQMSGYTPLMSHPERFDYYQKCPEMYYRFKEKGYLFQLDLLSLQGGYGQATKKTAIQLLAQGMIDFVGSDMHQSDHAMTLAAFLKTPQSSSLGVLL